MPIIGQCCFRLPLESCEVEMNSVVDFLPLLESASYLVQLFGVPVAIAAFIVAKRRERIDRENGTYDALDAKYQDFLSICLQNPDLPIFDSGKVVETGLSDAQEHRLQVALCILISILERAYLMYRDQSGELRRNQWLGWVGYIEDYGQMASFARYWPLLGEQFDSRFVAFVDETLARTSSRDVVEPVQA